MEKIDNILLIGVYCSKINFIINQFINKYKVLLIDLHQKRHV